MKKNLLVSMTLAFVISGGIQAQQYTEVGRMTYTPEVLAGCYTVDGKPLLLSSGDDDASIVLYDEEFSEVRTIEFNLPEEQHYKIVKARSGEIVLRDSNWTESDEYWYEMYPTREDRIACLTHEIESMGYGSDSIYTADDGTMWFVSYFFRYDYWDETGNSVEVTDISRPENGFCLTTDNRVFRFWRDYAWMYNGSWREYRMEDYSNLGSPSYFTVYSSTDGAMVENELVLSQALLNEDEKFEYFYDTWEYAPYDTIEFDRDYDDVTDSVVVHYQPCYTGMELRQEDGTVLLRQAYPKKAFYTDYYPCVLELGDKLYLGIHNGERQYSQGEFVFYSVDKSTGIISQVNTLPGLLRTYPNPARKGEVVTMDLPEAKSADAQRDVRVVSMDGRVMMQQHVERGERKVQIPLRRMPSGVYHLTLTENGRAVESSRIVVR